MEVVISWRTDSSWDRNRNVEIRVGNTAPSSTQPPSRTSNPVCQSYMSGTALQGVTTAKCQWGMTGRFVSIQLLIPTGEYLTLCEVQVFGPAGGALPPAPPPPRPPSPPPPTGMQELAVNRPAYQASTWSGWPGALYVGAGMAVDGEISAAPSASSTSSCASTDSSDEPWWFVDLGSAKLINTVRIFPSTNTSLACKWYTAPGRAFLGMRCCQVSPA